jgi:uncharacterized protein YbjT (DUF2867 family)
MGDLNVLWEIEEGLRRQPIPAAINRAANYMSNWDGMLDTVRITGTLPTMFRADLALPMVAPADLGEVAAARLVSPPDDIGVRYIEGPRLYSSRDVANAFSQALGQPIEVEVTPRGKWKEAFVAQGFSDAAADSYACMIAVSVDDGFDISDHPLRGRTTLEGYIRRLVTSS